MCADLDDIQEATKASSIICGGLVTLYKTSFVLHERVDNIQCHEQL
jgi:hypothetical protein